MAKRKQISENAEEILEMMKETKNVREYRKLQCIYLGDTEREMSAGEIGKITGYSENSVKRIHGE
jgi:DNA-directed RNA polymerase specialized sigma subunit